MADQSNPTTVASVEALIVRLMLTGAQIAERDKISLAAGERAYQKGVKALHLARALALKPQAEIDAAIARAKLSKKWDDERLAAAVYLTAYKLLSRSETGKRLGLTRNTVLSKLSRMGIGGEETAANPKTGKRTGLGRPAKKKSATKAEAGKRRDSAPPTDVDAEAAVAAISASVDEMVLAERAVRQRDAGARFMTVERYAPLHQPFAHVNSGFAPAGPLHRDDHSVFGVAAHGQLPLVALWQGDTERGRGFWTIMAQTETRPTSDFDDSTMAIRAKVVGKNTAGGNVYLISARTKELMDDKGEAIVGSDIPDAAAFVAAVSQMGIPGKDGLLQRWAVQPNGIGINGMKFGAALDPDELPVGLALESQTAAGYLGSFTSSTATMREKATRLRRPNTTLREAEVKQLAAQIGGPVRRLAITADVPAELAL